MKLNLLATLLFLPTANAQFEQFFAFIFQFLNPLISSLAQTACDVGTGALGLNAFSTCTCTGILTGFISVDANVECVQNNPICLDQVNQQFCGVGSTSVGFTAGGTGLSADAQGCLDLTLPSVPGFAEVTADKICITGVVGDGLQFSDCSVTLGDQDCVCTVCDSGIAANIDCSGVTLFESLLLPTPITGPKLESCALIDFTIIDETLD